MEGGSPTLKSYFLHGLLLQPLLQLMLGWQGLLGFRFLLADVLKVVDCFVCCILRLFCKCWRTLPNGAVSSFPFWWHYIIWTVAEGDFQQRDKFSPLLSTLQPFSRDIILYLSNLKRLAYLTLLINPALSEADPGPPQHLTRSCLWK